MHIKVVVRSNVAQWQQAIPQLRQGLAQGVHEVVEDIAAQAARSAPVNTGILRSAIGSRVSVGTGVQVRGQVYVGSQAPYAQAVEEGARPHWAPIGPLKAWARRKLGNERLAYAVRWAIARRGTRPRHFLRKAVDQVRPRIPGLISAALRPALRGLQ